MVHRIGLIVTGKEALDDFTLFVRTLEQWHPDAELFVYTDSTTAVQSVVTKATVHIRVEMDRYKGLSRVQMERTRGVVYDSLFKDYTYEKAAVLEWMFSVAPAKAAWFLDADISHLAPLPEIPPTAVLALSQHMIRPGDEARYGRYNAGFMWFRSGDMLGRWRELGHTSRFYEQAALEDLATAATATEGKLYECPAQVNFGWWRMQQGSVPQAVIQDRFSLFRGDTSVGIRYDGKPLQSIHTHWFSSAFECVAFRRWFDEFTRPYKTHKPIAVYRRLVGLA
jgi:hypothetical protein